MLNVRIFRESVVQLPRAILRGNSNRRFRSDTFTASLSTVSVPRQLGVNRRLCPNLSVHVQRQSLFILCSTLNNRYILSSSTSTFRRYLTVLESTGSLLFYVFVVKRQLYPRLSR